MPFTSSSSQSSRTVRDRWLHSRNVDKIDHLIRAQAKRFGVKIYHFVNVSNHLYLVLRIHDHQGFRSFLRAITGLIARHVLKAQRGSAKNLQFWIARPFTRLVSWGRDFKNINRYMEKNRGQVRAFTDWGFGVTDPDKIENLNTS